MIGTLKRCRASANRRERVSHGGQPDSPPVRPLPASIADRAGARPDHPITRRAQSRLATKNRRTLLREAEKHVGDKYTDAVLDSLYVIECSMRHFFIRAEMGKNAGRKKEEVDEDYKQAAALAALVAPYRHARLSAMKLAGDPNSPARFMENATADEMRAEIMKHIAMLSDAGVIDLKALPAPDGGIANRSISGGDQSSING